MEFVVFVVLFSLIFNCLEQAVNVSGGHMHCFMHIRQWMCMNSFWRTKISFSVTLSKHYLLDPPSPVKTLHKKAHITIKMKKYTYHKLWPLAVLPMCLHCATASLGILTIPRISREGLWCHINPKAAGESIGLNLYFLKFLNIFFLLLYIWGNR